MGNYLYVLAGIMVIAWIIGYFGTDVGGINHLFLIIAMIAVILRINPGRKVT
jgi:hypothetical protein